jgi:hypothetical protein
MNMKAISHRKDAKDTKKICMISLRASRLRGEKVWH